MKDTNGSWRAQKGSKVKYATDRVSGEAEILRVIAEARTGIGDGRGLYLVRDLKTGEERQLSGTEMRFQK